MHLSTRPVSASPGQPTARVPVTFLCLASGLFLGITGCGGPKCEGRDLTKLGPLVSGRMPEANERPELLEALSRSRRTLRASAWICVDHTGTVRSVALTLITGYAPFDDLLRNRILGWKFCPRKTAPHDLVCGPIDFSWRAKTEQQYRGEPMGAPPPPRPRL